MTDNTSVIFGSLFLCKTLLEKWQGVTFIPVHAFSQCICLTNPLKNALSASQPYAYPDLSQYVAFVFHFGIFCAFFVMFFFNLVMVVNDGSMRQEIEIAFLTLNGNKFIGTITPQEAKFSIYREKPRIW